MPVRPTLHSDAARQGKLPQNHPELNGYRREGGHERKNTDPYADRRRRFNRRSHRDCRTR